jgi:hypothetical protein
MQSLRGVVFRISPWLSEVTKSFAIESGSLDGLGGK